MFVGTELEQSWSLRRMTPAGRFFGADDVVFRRCVSDSRLVRPGDLFVAFSGSRHEASAYLADAISRGCAGVLAEAPIADLPLPVCVVSDARAAFGTICHELAGNPTEKLKLIGVTGTNGKTTTSCLIAGVLAHTGTKVGLIGTLGYFDGEEVEEANHTTPPADKLAELLARMADNGCTHAIMEVSSHALAQSRVAGAKFDAVCVTNVTRDHLDYHLTLGNYRAAKARMFDHLRDEGFAVVNADDRTAMDYLNRFDGPALTVGIENAAEITGVPVEQYASEQTFLISAGSETIAARTAMIGRHHISNCLMATAVGLTYGVPLSKIVRSLETAKHVPGRLERIECGQPFSVFVDYAHTPDALVNALKTVRSVVRGKVICVFGAGGERDQAKRPLMGGAVEEFADVRIVTNDNPRGEDPESIAEDILNGFADRRRATVILNRTQAIERALERAMPGDAVLIAGKGHERTQIIGDRRVEHDDGEVARRWLYEFQPFANS